MQAASSHVESRTVRAPAAQQTEPVARRNNARVAPTFTPRYVVAAHVRPPTLLTDTDVAVTSTSSLPRRRQGGETVMTDLQRLRRIRATMQQRAHDHNLEYGIRDPPPAYHEHASPQERHAMLNHLRTMRTRAALRDNTVTRTVPGFLQVQARTQPAVDVGDRRINTTTKSFVRGDTRWTQINKMQPHPSRPRVIVRTIVIRPADDRIPVTTIKMHSMLATTIKS